jgi:hypothetical protein
VPDRRDRRPSALSRSVSLEGAKQRSHILFVRGEVSLKVLAHLARAALTPWISIFTTNDHSLAKRARKLYSQESLSVYDPLKQKRR